MAGSCCRVCSFRMLQECLTFSLLLTDEFNDYSHARDFVNVRRYQRQGNIVILAGKATTIETVQEKKGVIR